MPRNEMMIARNILLGRRINEADRAERRRANATLSNPTLAPVLLPTVVVQNWGVFSNGAASPPAKPRRPENDTPWNPPQRHGGTRNVARNSKKTARGFTVFNGIEVEHESGIEEGVSLIMQADRRVASLRSQYKMVRYYDAEGMRRRHTFDYYVVLKDGTKFAVAVKPKRYQKRMEALLKQIAENGEYSGIDKFVVYTDAQATRPKVSNARHILWSRNHHDQHEVSDVTFLLGARTSIQFWEMLERGQKNWKRQAAIWHLIDIGVLQPVDQGERITDLSRLLIQR